MQFSSIVAIYILFFAASAFILLPFGVKTTEEVGGELVPGQAPSAPHEFNLPRHLLKAAVLGAVLFGIFYANWSYGWITPDDLNFFPSAADRSPG